METNELKMDAVATATDALGKLESYNIQITDYNGKTKYIVPLGVKRKKLRELFPNAKTEEITKHYDNHSCLIEVRFYLDRNDEADEFIANAHGASNTDQALDYVTDALSKAYRRLYHNLGLTTLKEANSDLSDEKDVDTIIDPNVSPNQHPASTTENSVSVTEESSEKPKRARRTKKDDRVEAAAEGQPSMQEVSPSPSPVSETAEAEINRTAVEEAEPSDTTTASAPPQEGMTLDEALQETIFVYGEKGDRPLSTIFKEKAEVVGMLAQRSTNKAFMNTLPAEERRGYIACQVIMNAIKADASLYDQLKGN